MDHNKSTAYQWINILEDHFNERKKAFLVFGSDHKLVHVSEFALEILELNENQVGVMTVSDIFPGGTKNPDLLIGADYNFQKIYDITYTTPSGRPVDLRLNIDQSRGRRGYIMWLELRSREITGTYRKVSSLAPYKDFIQLFDKLGIGAVLLDRNGLIIEHNQDFKKMLRLPGEWEGRNIYTFPPLHNNKLSDFIRNCISGKKKSDTKKFKIKYSSSNEPVHFLMSGIQISDLTGSPIGALISCRTES